MASAKALPREQIEITHTCGHVATHWLLGTAEERESSIEYRTGSKCPACFAAEAEERDRGKREEVEAALAKGGRELPPLEGTERQVVWAGTLRLAFLHFLLSGKAVQPEWLDRALDIALAQDEAKFWINRRHSIESPLGFVVEVIAESLIYQPFTVRAEYERNE